MREQNLAPSLDFDQNLVNRERAEHIERVALQLAAAAIRFSQIERIPRYTPEKRENDAEHSFMLALVAQEIAARHFPDLDTGLVAQFSTVHDLIELKTDDVPTYSLSEAELQAKATNEHAKLDELCSELPAYTARLLRTYEEQRVPEAQFVRLVDKLMPVLVDILGDGVGVMHRDYSVRTHQQLIASQQSLKRRFETIFPDPELKPLHDARNNLAQRFAQIFEPAPYIQDTLF